MSFKKIAQFETGNFNEWDNLTKTFFLKVNRCVRQVILPYFDEALDSMLGDNSEGTKKSINIEQYLDKTGIIGGVKVTIVYTIEDFHVETAPKEAVEQDVESLKNVLVSKGVNVTSLTINTSNGETTVIIDIPVEDKIEENTPENDKA